MVVTGTPGVGKTRLAKLLAKKFPDSELIEANEIAKKEKCIEGRGKFGAYIVNMGKLEKKLNGLVGKSRHKVVILEGHLLCDMKIRNAVAIVLREHLKTLEKRLAKRNYSKKKIEENVTAEATDYCGQHAEMNYQRVYELLSSDSKTLDKAISIVIGKPPKKQNIELLSELLALLKKNTENKKKRRS
ncbi:MAG: AAA family ATPase [Candidatus Micrarchaeia archaeon]